MPDFRKTVFHGQVSQPGDRPPESRPEVVLAGRSNVGKSSLVNLLAGVRRLARVSSTPGRTRQVLYFLVDGAFYLVDLPGYGYARVSESGRQGVGNLVDSYLASSRDIRLVVHLVDIRHDPTREDLLMQDWIRERGLACLVAANKADKLSASAVRSRAAALRDALSLPPDMPLLPLSLKDRTGLEPLREAILERMT